MRHHMKIKGFFRSLRKCKACWWSLQDHSAIQKSTCQPSKQQTTGRKKTASQKKNVTRNDKFKDDYIKCMKELKSKGYAKESLAITESGCCWCLPHHAVFSIWKSLQVSQKACMKIMAHASRMFSYIYSSNAGK